MKKTIHFNQNKGGAIRAVIEGDRIRVWEGKEPYLYEGCKVLNKSDRRGRCLVIELDGRTRKLPWTIKRVLIHDTPLSKFSKPFQKFLYEHQRQNKLIADMNEMSKNQLTHYVQEIVIGEIDKIQ